MSFRGTIQDKVRELQRAPEGTKKRWVVGLSAAAMAVVILLWVIYINLTLPSVKPRGIETAGRGESFWEVFGRGLTVVGRSARTHGEKIVAELRALLEAGARRVSAPNEFTIEGQ